VTQADVLLSSARAAVQDHDWQEALAAFTAADAVSPLSGEDLEAMAEAAYWGSHPTEALEASHRAFAAYLDADHLGDAASAALLAGRLHFVHGEMAAASAWIDRGRRILADLPECSAHAMLAWVDGEFMLLMKSHDQALERAIEVEAIAGRVGDRDLLALGRSMQGFIRLHSGDIDGGMGLLNEATAGAVAGELGPFATAEIMCEMVLSCLDVSDYERAAEWLDAAERAGRDIVEFPGCCRTHRATLHRRRGEWTEAHSTARQARAEVAGIEILHEGMALTETGELYRCQGDLTLAQKAFEEAYETGWPPQPGLALVLAAKGDAIGAAAMLARAVDRSADEPVALIDLLPAQVEVAIAAGDLETALAAAQALQEATSRLRTSAALGANACVEGLLLQAQGDLSGAATKLEQSVRSWQKARGPYEVAQCRMRLASVLLAAGDVGSAHAECAAARTTFDRLGAMPEAAEAARRLGQEGPQRSSNTFMFTDMVDSTQLLTAIGDDAWHAVRLWHDRTIRDLVVEHTGRVVKETGDGFFIAFVDPSLATACAVSIQRALAGHRRTHGFSPAVRIGLHLGSALSVDGDDFAGRDVVVAARISALAAAGEILISTDLAGELGDDVRVGPAVATTLKGIPVPVGVMPVDWR
jgi:class 3 adenylate cyclase/plasmid stabilization system protein ParE